MYQISSGLKVVNLTPHPINMLDGDTEITIPSHGILGAKIIEEPVEGLRTRFGVVNPRYQSTAEGWKLLADTYAAGADVALGSMLAMWAYPGWCYNGVPVEGRERVPVPLSDKVMGLLLAVRQQDMYLSEVTGIEEFLLEYAQQPTKLIRSDVFSLVGDPLHYL